MWNSCRPLCHLPNRGIAHLTPSKEMYSVKSTSFVHDRFALFIDCVGSPRQKLPTSFQRGPNPALPRLLSQSQTDRPQTAASEVSDLITPSCRKRPLKSRRPGPGGICAVSFFKFSSTHQAPNFRLHPTHLHPPTPALLGHV